MIDKTGQLIKTLKIFLIDYFAQIIAPVNNNDITKSKHS